MEHFVAIGVQAQQVLRLHRTLVLAAFLVGSSACARPAVAPGPSLPTPAVRLEAADRELRAGCFDCLASAFQQYDALRSTAAVADAASIGAARAAALLAIRERELGLEDSGHLTRAREIAAANPLVRQALADVLDIVDTLPVRGAVRYVPDDVALKRNQVAVQNRDAWTAELRARADQDALSAYVWIAFNCAYVFSRDHTVADWVAAAPSWRDTPLVRFKAASCGSYSNRDELMRLLNADPRFAEIHYLASLPLAFTGRIDEAMDHLLKAYAWRARWPAVTNSLGVDYIALEEFAPAIEFFDRTLAVVPDYAEAILNKAKAQTYAGQFLEALETLEQLLALNALPGDARYWRALTLAHLGRYDEAWDDIERAAKLIYNAEVPKLAGTIAYRRTQLDVSRGKFEEARKRNRDDCETGFYLGIVLSDLRQWTLVPEMLIETVSCFEKLEATLNQEIASIRTATEPSERQARQITKREDQIASNRRMIATSWYNTAVSYFNLSRREDARHFAERVAADAQYGERARELLARLP